MNNRKLAAVAERSRNVWNNIPPTLKTMAGTGLAGAGLTLATVGTAGIGVAALGTAFAFKAWIVCGVGSALIGGAVDGVVRNARNTQQGRTPPPNEPRDPESFTP